MCWEKSKSGNKKEAVKKTEVHSTEADVGFCICVQWIWFLWGRKLYGIWQICGKMVLTAINTKRSPNPKQVWWLMPVSPNS